jgi:hypothetical protein
MLYGPLCVPYSLFCFIMDQHVYPTLYFVLLWTIMCTLPSMLLYYGPYVYPTLYFILLWTIMCTLLSILFGTHNGPY